MLRARLTVAVFVVMLALVSAQRTPPADEWRYYGGDAQISGRVSGGGAVVVRVGSSQGNAVGSGRLRGNSGGGSFRGSAQQGPCAGTWSSQRTGG